MKTSLINKKISSLQKANRQLRASVRALSKATESRHFAVSNSSTYSREDAYRPTSAEDYLQLFETYVHVFACVDVIAQNLAKLPLRLYNLKGVTSEKDKRGEEITDGQMWSLLNRPNKFMTGYGLIYSIAAFVKLCGIYYGEKVGSSMEQPTELWTLRPDWMRIIPDAREMIGGYEYTVDGSVIKYQADEIIRIKSWHPRSEFYGLGIVQPSANSIITDLYAMKYSKQFFKQGGHLQWYMTSKEEISDESFKRLEQQIKTKFAGIENAHAPAVLDSGLEIKELGGSPDRTVLLPQKTLSRDEVCEAFRVPALMLGLPNETHYNNADAQYIYFYEQTIQPLGREIEDTLNRDIFWPLDIECAFDYSSVKVMRPNVGIISTTARTLVDGKIMTPNEVREKVLKEAYPDLQPLPEGDAFPEAAPAFGFKSKELDLPTVLKLVEVMIKGGQGSGHHGHYPSIQGRGSAKAITKEVINDIEMDVIHGRFLDAFDKLRTHGVSNEDVTDLIERARKRSRIDEHLEEKGIRTKKITLEKKNELVLHKANLIKLTYQDILDVVGPHYQEYGEAVLKVVNSNMKKIAFVKKDMISEALNSLDPVTKKMAQALLKTEKKLLTPIIKAEYQRAKKSTIDEKTLKEIEETVGDTLEARIDKSLGFVSDTAKERVEKHLTDSIESGSSVDTIAKDIEKLFFKDGEEYVGQAQNIARTETLKFTEASRFATISEMGFTEKEWIHSGHDDPRPDHLAADGEVVKMNEKFSTGLRFPGDPEGDAGDVCNCGCTMVEHIAAAVEEE